MEKTDFDAAARRNGQRLFLLALSFTKNRADAEDVLQNVFLKLWRRKEPFGDGEHTDKWLTAVCVNECRNLLRTPWRRRVTTLTEAEALPVFDDPRDETLYRAVAALPTNERIVIHLFYYEDLSVAEIAKTLRISESAVKTRLCRARKKLKEILGDDDIDE